MEGQRFPLYIGSLIFPLREERFMIHVTPVAGNLSLRRKMRMLATKAGVGLLVFALVLAGCASSKNQTDSDAGGHSAQTVHVYDEANLPASAFETVGEVTGAACREDVYDSSPTREEGVEALKRQAERRGGKCTHQRSVSPR